LSISIDEVRRIARLAKLSFSEDEEAQLQTDLDKILDYMSKLAEVDLDDAAGLPYDAPQKELRQDKVDVRAAKEKLLSSAPASKDGLFCVPKVIE